MRINREMLLKIANDSIPKYLGMDHTILAAYLQGSMLGDSPLIGNTADIDLCFVHTDEVVVDREIVRISDEVHLDIAHHDHRVYRQPRELRLHPWLGPTIYGCKIMYDPQHFIDFVQASVRGQFHTPANTLSRVRKQAEHAREMWEAFYANPHPPSPDEASLYLHALEHAANAVAGLSGPHLTERRFLLDFPGRAEAVNRPGLFPGFLGLLGASSVDAGTLRSWIPEWSNAYHALLPDEAPVRLHPHRWLYYLRAVEVMLESPSFQDALWPLWRTWTHAVCAMPAGASHLAVWQLAGEQLGLLGPAFTQKIAALDAYLDTVEDVLDTWARQNGG